MSASPSVTELVAPQPVLVSERWPRMGREAFHGVAGDFIQLVEPCTEADPVAILAQLLFFVGSVMGCDRFTRVGPTKHCGNLFMLLVGRSGRARKGTSFGFIEEMAREVAPWWLDEVTSGLSTPAGLAFDAQDTEENRDKEKIRPFMESEFTSVLKVSRRDGNPLSEALRQLWEGDRMSVKTRREPLKASRVHLSLVGHVTDESLALHWGKDDSYNGLGNRFLWFRVKRSKELSRPRFLNSLELHTIYQRMKDVVGFARQPAEMTFSDNAWASWDAIYSDLTADMPGEVGALTDRGEAQIMRLSMIYAVLDRSDVIEVDHLMAAAAVWEYCFASVSGIFSQRRSKCSLMLEQLLDGSDRVTRLQYTTALNRNSSEEELDAGERELVRLGLCTVELVPSGGQGGRPTKVYVRTPLYEETKERINLPNATSTGDA